jgi:hypothetical protein
VKVLVNHWFEEFRALGSTSPWNSTKKNSDGTARPLFSIIVVAFWVSEAGKQIVIFSTVPFEWYLAEMFGEGGWEDDHYGILMVKGVRVYPFSGSKQPKVHLSFIKIPLRCY